MVNTRLYRALNDHYLKLMPDLIKNFPGQFITISQGVGEYDINIFETKFELDKALSKYKGLIGSTIFVEEIPDPENKYDKEPIFNFVERLEKRLQ